MKQLQYLLLALLAALALAACGSQTIKPALSLNLTSASVTAGDSKTLTFTASVSGGGTVSWTLSGPGSLSANSGPSVQYTPPAAGITAQTTATLTASLSGSTLTSSATIIIAPAPGSLEVSVSGLPSGTNASVTVMGPGNFSQTLTGSKNLTGLALGSYSVTAASVSAGGTTYVGTVTGSPATVAAGSTPTVGVVYAAQAPGMGSLQVNVTGLPNGANANVSVSGPNNFSQTLTSSKTLNGLAPGSYTVTAADVTPYKATVTGSPATVKAGATVTVSVAYAVPAAQMGSLSLTINGLPTRVNASVSITGPNGFNQILTATKTLGNLVVGTYTLTPSPVTYYTPSGTIIANGPANQQITVSANTTATATLTYAPTKALQALWVTLGNNTLAGYNSSLLTQSGTPAPSNLVSNSFLKLSNIVFDAQGNLWGIDPNQSSVLEFAAASLTASGAPAPKVVLGLGAVLNGASGLAFDPQGDLWAASAINNTIVKFTPDQLAHSGSPTPSLTLLRDGLNPVALALDASGNLWIGQNGQILEFAANLLVAGYTGGPSRVWSGYGSIQTMTFDAGGNLWIADSTGAIGEFVPAQLTQTTTPSPLSFSSGLPSVNSLASDANGNLWVAGGGVRAVEFKPPFTSTSSPAVTLTTPHIFNTGLALKNGNLWVSDSSQGLYGFTPAQLVQSGTPAPALTLSPILSNPYGVTFDAGGNLWVTNFQNNTLEEFTNAALASANPAPAVVISGPALQQPVNLAFDAAGSLWVANFGLNSANTGSLLKYTPDQLGTSGSPAPAVSLVSAALQGVSSLAFDAAGNLWVSNFNSSTLQQFTLSQLGTSGSPVAATTITSSNTQPTAIAFDPQGNLWSTNNGSRTVTAYSPAQLAHGGSPSPAITLSPSGLTSLGGLAFDALGNLWVGDFLGNKVLEFAKDAITASNTNPPALTLGVNSPHFFTFGPQIPTLGAQSLSVSSVEQAPSQTPKSSPF